MKKLAIISAYLSRGGAERVVVYLSQYMQEQGVDTTIITLGIIIHYLPVDFKYSSLPFSYRSPPAASSTTVTGKSST